MGGWTCADKDNISWDGNIHARNFIGTTSGGSGGTSNHASLSNLDYANAGHTGFCSSAIFDTHAASAAIHYPMTSIGIGLDQVGNASDDTTISMSNIYDVNFNDCATFNVTGASFPVATIKRITSTTNLPRAGFGSLTTSTGNMVDGFASGFILQIEDTTSGVQSAAGVYGVRNGADNNGALALYTFNAGTGTEHMRIDTNGRVGIGTTTPSTKSKLDVSGVASAAGFITSGVASCATIYAGAENVGTHIASASIHLPASQISHASIAVLDYANSGHTDFASAAGVTKVNTDLTNASSALSTHMASSAIHWTSASLTTLASSCSAQDHGTASAAQIINAIYGTAATAPSAALQTEGCIYLQYTA